MRKKIYLCLAVEIVLIIAATIVFFALRGRYDDVSTCAIYFCILALINACSTAFINAAMFEDEIIDLDGLDDLDDDDDESEVVDDNAVEDNTDDGIIRGADGKL